MGSAVFSYRNFCFDEEATVTDVVGSFATNAPIANLQTPQLGMLAIGVNGNPAHTFDCVFRPGSPTYSVPVRICALLNHNILLSYVPVFNPFVFTIFDVSGRAWFNSNAQLISSIGADGSFQNHAFVVVPDGVVDNSGGPNNGLPLDLDHIYKVRYAVAAFAACGTRDPYTGAITTAPFQAGAIWAGPVFIPSNGISLEGFGQSAADNSRVLRSIGGQVWTTPEIRQRTGSVEFSGLTESEVYALAPEQSLQQLAIYAGVSRPIIVLPLPDDDDLSYLQGIYGFCMQPPKWASTDKVLSNGVRVRLYTGSLELMEAR